MHSKGPWGIMYDGPKSDGEPWVAHMEAAPGLTIGSPDHTESICRVSGYLRPVKANARLIAASPLLLEALKAALPRMSHKAECVSFNPTDEWMEEGSIAFGNCNCEISIVKAALLAAEGGKHD